ncbi:MAG: phosphate ABC transporter permease [Gammaproteobacteria bacterium]
MTDTDKTVDSLLPDFNSPAAARHRNYRHIKDVCMRYLMALGGIGVIIAIVLIAFYLFYIVIPMFKPSHIERLAEYPVPADLQAESLYYAMEEQHEIGLRVTTDGSVVFFSTADGMPIHQQSLAQQTRADVTAFAAGDPSQRLLAIGLDDGTAMLAQHEYKVTYPNDVRLITPHLQWPLGDTPIQLDPLGKPIALISAQTEEEQTTIVALTEDSRLLLTHIAREESLLGDTSETIISRTEIPLQGKATHLLLDVEQRELYVAGQEGTISYYDISDKSRVRLVQRVNAVESLAQISSLAFLSGGISILVGDTAGNVTQWFPVRDEENNYTLERIRGFEPFSTTVTGITPEYFRKGFLAIDADGYLTIYHTTAHRTVKRERISEQALKHLAIAPRANAMLLEDSVGQLQFWKVDNEHPEISWQSIWGKVWYESRDKPEYIWQSSSASSDFEPKFSLTPLAFGTLKAAFYAMLFAIPMAILGAIYTAYFMSAGMRNIVKPTIEIMEALPTVILGFLAGLWFAPFVEQNMPGLFLFVLLLPLVVIGAAYAWNRLPEAVRHKVPEGWEAALLLPVVVITGVFAFAISQPVEIALFDGNMPLWLTDELGIAYDQRNSLVVGIAMGFAVIPTIFSISEDAVYSVPKHLTTGSLAMGATAWQTMVRLVILTASPGIFSAVMIGTGRAVGETMIVLMATGNTAIMDMNIFEGFRALSANIAVEMPESEVGSTHYRILFLAGLVLFLATFMFNTLAEVVRQRLRVKYSSL